MNGEIYIETSEISAIVNKTIAEISEYLKHRDVQDTERQRVRATLRAITTKIENDREMFEAYLNKSFEERERLYQVGEKLLQFAMHDKDIETTKQSLNFILDVYNKQPIDGFLLKDSSLNMSLLLNR